MTLFDIFILSIALSLDAMVVSFSNGLIFQKNRLKNSMLLAFTVGFFQFFMPIIGYSFTQFVTEYVKPYSHWLVFGIFFILGIKFIKDALSDSHATEEKHDFSTKYILTVGIATSIDALFAGVSISLASLPIIFPAIIIGIITFLNSMLGFWSANLIKHLSTKTLEISGGIILILLGFKVLFTAVL